MTKGSASYTDMEDPGGCPSGFTYVNGSVDPNSFTYNSQTGDVNFNISNYADGSGISGSVDLAFPASFNESLAYNTFGPPSAQTWTNASTVVDAPGKVEMGAILLLMNPMFAADAGPVASTALGLGKTAAQLLKSLKGMSKSEAREALSKAGFKQKGVTKGGYETWVHPDGSRITIGPDGGVDRIPPASVGKGFRYDPGTGAIRRPHSFPEEKVN